MNNDVCYKRNYVIMIDCNYNCQKTVVGDFTGLVESESVRISVREIFSLRRHEYISCSVCEGSAFH